jgi:ribonuclease HI
MGQGLTNTINRAELAGILIGLQKFLPDTTHITINTDSLCSLLQIQKQLLSPDKHQFHPHKDLLEAIATALHHRCRQNHTITLQKVTAHIGIPGNETADYLATHGHLQAHHYADHTVEPHTMDYINNDPFRHLYWPHQQTPTNPDPQPLSSLKATPHTPPQLSTRRQGIYQTLWQELQPHLLPNCLGHINHLPPKIKKVTHKYRMGCIYNQKLAHRMGHAPSPTCPHCGAPDSGSHLLGGCTHPHIAGLRILRHNDAVRAIARLIRTSAAPHIRNALAYMDAGKAPDALIASEDSRLPSWILNLDPSEERQSYRPDILLLPLTDQQCTGPVREEILKESNGLYIIEVGFCSDTRFTEHFQAKARQHEDLLRHLKEKDGWQKVTLLPPLLFGIGGSLYRSTLDALTKQLLIPKHKAMKTMRKIQDGAAHRAYQIVHTRRHLDMSTNTNPRPRNQHKPKPPLHPQPP